MKFEKINPAYNEVFKSGELSIGVVVPIENYSHSTVPSMHNHLQKVKLIEKLGFKALWVRDVPFNVPSFGDAGQTFDPFTYLGFLAGQTHKIALGVSSIALPLHHPVHVAKSAATIDQLSNGRLILGVASGDRFEEYPAMNIDYEHRGELFRQSFDYIRAAQQNFPVSQSANYGHLNGSIDILPKATGHKIPMLVTGNSRQTIEWNAKHGDGWMYYPRSLSQQRTLIKQWREMIGEHHDYSKPFMQPLHIDLAENANHQPEPIHLGYRLGLHFLKEYLFELKDMGVNHLALNLRFNVADTEKTLVKLAENVLPYFHINEKEEITS